MSNDCSPPAAKKRRTTMGRDRKKPPMHSGRWTPEEEQYVEGMIGDFSAGLLPIADGTTLRSFLAKMLNCNPKRVSKKYDGNPIYNGKSSYVRAQTALPPAEASERQENLLELERKFREALSTMQRVESRLRSLTSHLMEDRKEAAAAAEDQQEDAWPSNSAVSSLTEEGGENPNEQPISEEASMSVAKVSQTATDEEAASHMLLQLNASPPRPPCAVAVKDEAEPASASGVLGALTAISMKSMPQPSPDNSINCSLNNTNGGIQGLLQKLQEIRKQHDAPQQQPPQQTPAPATAPIPSNLQGLLGLSGPQQRLESPIAQPQNTQQKLQQLLQSLQGNKNVASLQQQQQTNLQGMLQALQQKATPQQQQSKPEAVHHGLKMILDSLQKQPSRAPPPPPPQQASDGSKALADLLREIAGASHQKQQQPPIGSFLQPMASPPPTTNSENLHGLLTSLVAQQQKKKQQQPRQQPQQHIVDGMVSTLMTQLRQNLAQLPQPSTVDHAQGLLLTLQSQVQQATPKHPPMQQQQGASSESLQQLLMQLRQVNSHQRDQTQ